jgi:nucleotide-binding universal stress UspA family protein
MYRKILIAYNGTLESRSALYECIRLSPKPETEVHVLAVVVPPPLIIGGSDVVLAFNEEEDIAVEKARLREELFEAQKLLSEAGFPSVTHLETGEPVDVIESLASSLGVDLLIVGHSRHRSWATRWWKGATDAMLIERIQCSLLIAPSTPETAVDYQPLNDTQVVSGATLQ